MENIKATEITAGMTISYAGDTATVVEVKNDNSGFGFDLVMDNGESWFIFKGMEVELVSVVATAEVSANNLVCSCGQRHAIMSGRVIAVCKCGATYKIPALGYLETSQVEPMTDLELRLHNQTIWAALGRVSALTIYNDAMIAKLSA